jgi:hypothetical protein
MIMSILGCIVTLILAYSRTLALHRVRKLGGQPTEQNAESTVEFGKPIVGGPRRRERTDVRAFADPRRCRPKRNTPSTLYVYRVTLRHRILLGEAQRPFVPDLFCTAAD